MTDSNTYNKNFVTLFIFISSFLASGALNAQTWVSSASQPFQLPGRHHPVGFTIDGIGYMGTGASAQGLLDDFSKYDPETDTWQILNDFSGSARSFAYGLSYNGKGYLGFGFTSVGEENDLWEYSPETDSWRELTSCPCAPRTHPAMVEHNGIIYVGLGGSPNGNLKDWWAYDIERDSWTQKPDYPSSRRHHPYHFALGDFVYVAFGHGESIYNDLYRYDPASESWDQMASLPAEGRVAGTQFSYNGKGYILSGDGDDHGPMPTGEFWEYDPSDDSWTSLPGHPGISSRWAPGSFIIGSEVYFIGGLEQGALMTNVFKYDLGPVSSTKNIYSESMKIHPNPVHDIVTLDIQEPILEQYLLNAIGQRTNLSQTGNQIDVSHLSAGNYILVSSTKDNAFVSKFAKL